MQAALAVRWLREPAFFLAYLALTIALTWPLAIRIDTAVPDLGDPLLNAWIIDWVSYALTHRPLGLFDAPFFHPARMPLAFSENLIGIALLMLPFHLSGLPALTVYNLALLLGFAHAGYGAFVLARVITQRTLPSFVGGIFFAFVSYKFDHLSHLQIIWSGWLPLLFAALIVYWRKPAAGQAVRLFAAFLMNGLTNIHFLLFGGVALCLAVATLAIFDPRTSRRFWLQLAGALGIAGLLLLPILLPYRTVADLYNMKRVKGEIELFSATPSDWLHTTTRSRVYGGYQPADTHHERMLFPGLFALFLVAAAAVMTPQRVATTPDQGIETSETPPLRDVRRAPLLVLDGLIVLLAGLVWFGAITERFTINAGKTILLAIRGTDIPFTLLIVLMVVRLTVRFPRAMGGDRGQSLRSFAAASRFPPAVWAAALWIAVGVLGSFGLNAFFHTFLYERMEAFEALRVPARWAVIAYTGMAVWIALGAAALMRRRVMAVLIPLLMIAEVTPIIGWEHAPVRVPPFYRWLKAVRVGPVLELPPEDNWAGQFLYLLYATEHRVPLMNGISGFEPPVHLGIRDAYFNDRMNESFTTFLEENGARLVVVHGDALSHRRDVVGTWIRSSMASGRLAFVRRFDHGITGDWVFGLTGNLPDWRTYREEGRGTPQELERFLAGLPTYNSSTFGRLEMPPANQLVEGRLRISGWALSPRGIRRATALLYSGRLRVPMQLYQRPDVSARFPWYPTGEGAGIVAELPKRPKGYPRDTDVQVELVDNSGNVTRLRDVTFRWN